MSSFVPVVSFDQMKGSIGSLLWLWSRVERELAAAIRELHAGEVQKSAHGIGRSLEIWSKCILSRGQGRAPQINLCHRIIKLLTDALAVRNLVCHGLIGISAQLHKTDDEAHLEVELDGDRRLLTWSELNAMFSWMSKVAWVIRDLTAAVMDTDAARGNLRVAVWQGFPRQR